MTPTPFLIYGKRGSFHLLYTSPRHHYPLWFPPKSSPRPSAPGPNLDGSHSRQYTPLLSWVARAAQPDQTFFSVTGPHGARMIARAAAHTQLFAVARLAIFLLLFAFGVAPIVLPVHAQSASDANAQ